MHSVMFGHFGLSEVRFFVDLNAETLNGGRHPNSAIEVTGFT